MMRRTWQNRLLFIAVWSAPTSLLHASPSEFLSRRLQAVVAEIEAVEQQESEMRSRWQDQQAGLAQHRRELADKILEAAFERERLSRRRSRRADQLMREQEEAERLEAAAGHAFRELHSLTEALQLHLAESPDRESFARGNARPFSSNSADDRGDLHEQAELAIRQLQLFDEVHAAASRIRLINARIHTRSGVSEDVELLAAGRVAYVYRTVASGRLGMAVASPADAEGYRWADLENRRLRAAVESLFDRAAAPAPGPLAIPMDVTGRMTAESGIAHTGIGDRIRQGGVVMIPLLLVALAAAVLMAERILTLAGAGRGGNSTADAIIGACRNGNFELAETLAAKRSGVTPRVLNACLRRRLQGKHAMEDAIQEQLLHEAPRLERFLSGIAVLGATAPLLGLLGTVTGIIQTFAVITAFGNAEPGAMAGGISEALLTTAAGLAVAIPILLVHSLLRGKADHIVGDAEKNAATLLNTIGEGDG